MENTSNEKDVIKITSKKLIALKDAKITNDLMNLKSHELREKFSEEIKDAEKVRTPKCISLDDAPLIEPLDYIWDTGGKHTRALIVQYLTNLFGSTNNRVVEKVVYGIEAAHNISLLIDDVEDNTNTRRGEPCAHTIYGKAFTVNAGYYAIFKGLSSLAEEYDVDDPEYDPVMHPKMQREILKIALNSVWEAHLGQGYDLLWTQKAIIPSMNDFIEMVSGKTGVAFYYLAEAARLIAKYDKSVTNHYADDDIEEIKHLMKNIGIFYQLRDDYINITSPKYWLAKGFCEDFDEKKVSFLFVLLNQIDSDDSTFEKLHELKSCTNKKKLELYQHFENKGVLTAAYSYLYNMKTMIEQAEQAIVEKNGADSFIYSFFSKIEIEPPLESSKVKQFMLMNNIFN